MVTRRRTIRQSRNTLKLNQLESRETPAGNISAALSGGILTLTGDDAANVCSLRMVSNGIEVIGTAGTQINGQASATLSGAVNAITAVMKDGNDLIDIDAASAFDISGNASFDLGDGANTLRMVTSDALSIGGNLIVKAADGFDTIDLDGNVTSKIAGALNVSLGVGGSDVLLHNVDVLGNAGLSFVAGAGDDLIDLTSVTVSKATSIVAGAGSLAVNLTEDVLGSLSLTTVGKNVGNAAAGLAVDIVDTTIDGALKLKSNLGIDLDLEDVSLGSLNTIGGVLGDVDIDVSGAVDVAGNFLVDGGETTLDIVGGVLDVAGNLQVQGRELVEATIDSAGSLIVDGHATIQSALGDAVVAANGVVTTIGKNLTVIGRNLTDISIDTSSLSKVFGQVFFRGGIDDDILDISSNFEFGKNLSINFGGGDNIIDLGDVSGVLKVAGNLFIDTFDGIDEISLNHIEVGGITDIVLGAGADILNVLNGTHFIGRVFVNLAAGADMLNFASFVSNSAAVLFSAQTFIRTGLGNDSLNLGLSTSLGGNLNTAVVFDAARNVLDAGFGLDAFVQADAQFSGSLSFLGL